MKRDNRDFDFTIKTLGPRKILSPLKLSTKIGDSKANFVDDNERVLYQIDHKKGEKIYSEKNALEIAGPREKIYFDPTKVRAAIVTCGGLSPGLNNVIRSIVYTLWYLYGTRSIFGIKYGYHGFLPEEGHEPIVLTPEVVSDIHNLGGTILGTSRGGGDRTEDIVDTLERMNINMLFVIGGDGTQKGARDITNEIEKRGLKIAVVGIPKTIDNDLYFVDKTFGFDTAVEKAVEAIQSSHTEAKAAYNGVGLVKLMGRHSGFIAAHATLATNLVNFVLIPEIPFDLEGPNGFLTHLKNRLLHKHHAVIVVAEGAGQDLLIKDPKDIEYDESGNIKLKDIGVFLKNKIAEFLKREGIKHKIIYIDPSYMIRSIPANSSDARLCARLGQNAVHAAMSGKTGLLVSQVNNRMVHVPIEYVVEKRKQIDPDGDLWRDVIETTGQPLLMKNEQ